MYKQNGISTVNWQDPISVIILTRCLLKESYKIDYWDIPDSNLCPTINSRRSYIDWIQFLL